ncbi:hypothetical protein [Phascolarctobacterium faecium]|jgi:hypothetical protein|uniref:hypothetical protein n=1 Tax=Phascolarctobacterium faecium TaxID=33025 RepID=UPI0020667218|nr:MAG TPA: hypothetical protein [Caudoviricetes sp.]
MINVKVMLNLIKDEPEDAYIPIVKSELVALLKEVKMLRYKNSKLGSQKAKLKRDRKQ